MKKELIGWVWYRKCSCCWNIKKINYDNFSLRVKKDTADLTDIKNYYTICRLCKNNHKKVKLITDPELKKKQSEYKKNRYHKYKEEKYIIRKEWLDKNKEKIRKYEREYKKKVRKKQILEKIKQIRYLTIKQW